jgi:hypothetical protein
MARTRIFEQRENHLVVGWSRDFGQTVRRPSASRKHGGKFLQAFELGAKKDDLRVCDAGSLAKIDAASCVSVRSQIRALILF